MLDLVAEATMRDLVVNFDDLARHDNESHPWVLFWTSDLALDSEWRRTVLQALRAWLVAKSAKSAESAKPAKPPTDLCGPAAADVAPFVAEAIMSRRQRFVARGGTGSGSGSGDNADADGDADTDTDAADDDAGNPFATTSVAANLVVAMVRALHVHSPVRNKAYVRDFTGSCGLPPSAEPHYVSLKTGHEYLPSGLDLQCRAAVWAHVGGAVPDLLDTFPKIEAALAKSADVFVAAARHACATLYAARRTGSSSAQALWVRACGVCIGLASRLLEVGQAHGHGRGHVPAPMWDLVLLAVFGWTPCPPPASAASAASAECLPSRVQTVDDTAASLARFLVDTRTLYMTDAVTQAPHRPSAILTKFAAHKAAMNGRCPGCARADVLVLKTSDVPTRDTWAALMRALTACVPEHRVPYLFGKEALLYWVQQLADTTYAAAMDALVATMAHDI